MALKSSNKVDTNVYEIEVTVAPEEFTQACKDAYLKRRKSIQLPGFRNATRIFLLPHFTINHFGHKGCLI